MTAARLATDRLTRALLNVAARGARTHSSDPTGHLSDDLGLSASTEHYPPRFGCESLIVTGDDIGVVVNYCARMGWRRTGTTGSSPG
jgi:hypothetical protein